MEQAEERYRRTVKTTGFVGDAWLLVELPWLLRALLEVGVIGAYCCCL